MIRITIKGLQEAQRATLQTIAAVKPSNGLGRAVQYMAIEAHRMAISFSHVDTGAMRASHVIDYTGPARYVIHLSESARNPRTGQRTSVYGPYEHERGASHAFYERTWRNGDQLASRALSYLRSLLP